MAYLIYIAGIVIVIIGALMILLETFAGKGKSKEDRQNRPGPGSHKRR